MALAERLDTDFKAALKAKDQARLSILRLVRSAVKNVEIAQHGAASDEDIIPILQREIKQHRETIESLKAAGREAGVGEQEAEIQVLQSYLPAQLSEGELRDAVTQAIEETHAHSMADMGKVMGAVMPKVKGRATGDAVGQMVREILSNGA